MFLRPRNIAYDTISASHNVLRRHARPIEHKQMRARLVRIDLEYRLAFARPAFMLLTRKFDIAEALASALATLYTVNSNDVRIIDSNTLDDIEVKVDLFNRNGRFRFNANRLKINFQNVSSKRDGEIVLQVLDAALTALEPFLSNIAIEQEVMNASLSYEAIEGQEAIGAYFAPLKTSDFLKRSKHVGLKFAEFDERAKKTLALDLSPSWSINGIVLVSANQFSESDLAEPIRTRINAYVASIERVLPQLGFSVEQSEAWK